MNKILIIAALFIINFGLLKNNTKESLKEKIDKLCSTEFEGRLAGSEGYNKAAKYVEEFFDRIGLEPAFGNSYKQQFTVEYNKFIENPEVILRNKDEIIKLENGSDYVFRGFTGSGEIVSKIVFCGYGLRDSASGYNDFRDIDVKNKIVMIFKQAPAFANELGIKGGWMPREKANLVDELGGAGIILISKPNDDNPQEPIGSVYSGGGKYVENIPQVHISLEKAHFLFKNESISLSQIQKNIDSLKKPFSFELNSSAEMKVKTSYNPEAVTYNIAGLKRGTGESENLLVVGAHLDHIGKHGNITFYGANDNASGSAAVMEIADAIKNTKTKSDILFVLFSAEESGLYGAKYFVKNYHNIDNVTAMYNFDCIGFGDSLEIGGKGNAKDLYELAKMLDNKKDRILGVNSWEGGGADAQPFYDKGIKTLYFVTKNSYEHLHKITDLPKTLNLELYSSIVNLSTKIIKQTALAE